MSRSAKQQHSHHQNGGGGGGSGGGNGGSSANAGAGNNGGHHQQQQQQQQQNTARRGNKTLGWYLSGLNDVSNRGVEGNGGNKHLIAHRKGSLQEAKISATTTTIGGGGGMSSEEQRKGRTKYRFATQSGGRPRANSSSLSVAKSTPSRRQQQQKQQNQNAASLAPKDQQQQQVQTEPKRSLAKWPNGNYWYYDEASDGYCYEHNGTRGWRKNNAKIRAAVRSIEEAQKWEQMQQFQQQQNLRKGASLDSAAARAQPTTAAALPSLLTTTGLQFSGKFPMNNGGAGGASGAFNSQMAIKYCDNDGFFYESGSVDGWKRLQPGATPPNGSPSFGARGMKGEAQGLSEAVPRRKPLHYQAYQQPPQLNALDLKELLFTTTASVLAQQQQNNNNNSTQGGRMHNHNPHHHHNNNNYNNNQHYIHHQHQHNNSNNNISNHHQRQCCDPSPSATCCCAIATAVTRLFLQKQLMENNKVLMSENKRRASTFCPVMEEEFTKSPPNYDELDTVAAINRLANKSSQPIALGTNWQMPRPKWNSQMGDGGEEKALTPSTGLVVGSFEEPYEFYWSGDETATGGGGGAAAGGGGGGVGSDGPARSQSGGAGNGAYPPTAASVSSMDDEASDELGVEAVALLQQKRPSIAPIGSEAFAALGAKRASLGGATMMCRSAQEKLAAATNFKRPDTLELRHHYPRKFSHYEPIVHGEILRQPDFGKENGFNGQQQQPHEFDVDKFIADLPIPADHERVLNALRNPFRTPTGSLSKPANASLIGLNNTTTTAMTTTTKEPSTAESPLFTPVFPGKSNPWSTAAAAYNNRPPASTWAYP